MRDGGGSSYRADEKELASGGFTVEDADLEESDDTASEDFEDEDIEDFDLYDLQDDEEDKL